eukprot:2126351-Rhodomonas_salina.3
MRLGIRPFRNSTRTAHSNGYSLQTHQSTAIPSSIDGGHAPQFHVRDVNDMFESFEEDQLQPSFLIESTPARVMFQDPEVGLAELQDRLPFSDLDSMGEGPEDDIDYREAVQNGWDEAQGAWGGNDVFAGLHLQPERMKLSSARKSRHKSNAISQSLMKQRDGSMVYMGVEEEAEYRVDRAGMNMYHPHRKVCYYWNEVQPNSLPPSMFCFASLMIDGPVAAACLPVGEGGRRRHQHQLLHPDSD